MNAWEELHAQGSARLKTALEAINSEIEYCLKHAEGWKVNDPARAQRHINRSQALRKTYDILFEAYDKFNATLVATKYAMFEAAFQGALQETAAQESNAELKAEKYLNALKEIYALAGEDANVSRIFNAVAPKIVIERK